MRDPRSVVPCNGCTACCRNDLIVLHPEHGDDPAIYRTKPVVNPLTGRPALSLERQANGDCVYLDRRAGCTIWDRAPAVCQRFDCGRMVAHMSRAELKAALRRGFVSLAVLKAGRRVTRARRRAAAGRPH